MNFQDLLKVEKSDWYLDIAFRRAKDKVNSMKGTMRGKDPVDKDRKKAIVRIESITGSVKSHMGKIVTAFPNVDNLPEFYFEMVKSQLDYVKLKKSLGAVEWVRGKADEFAKAYRGKIKGSRSREDILKHMKEYYGRISSFVKRIDKNLKYLEESRKVMKSFPAVKTSVPTVALYGFPNAGKTTLLKKLTTSKAEVNSYAFTTKTINIGYYMDDRHKIQILDTPGTLNRMDKMNDIEMQAELALKYCADMIVFVLDLTGEYPIDKQIELLKKVERRYKGRKEFILFLSKMDLVKDNSAVKGREYISDVEELKKLIVKIK
jgi:nucleolar GTP-binding protein